jgi:2-methylisocitrate lyase-like PEP mutase family enzyme
MTFHDLHHGELPLLLPNAWDVASALAFVEAGFPAVGTTSLGVAASAGHPDGGRATAEANQVLAGRLATLPRPVSFDVEDGYSDDPEQVAVYVAGIAAAGPAIAGVNIEDSTAGHLVDPRAHAAKVAAVKHAVPGLFVNSRVDTYWLGQDATVPATLERAGAAVAAGADGIFVPGATDPDDLRVLTSAIPVPVNVLPVPGLSLAELGRLGVRRVSTGSLPYRAALEAAVTVATAVRDGTAVPPAVPYARVQELLVGYADARD